MFIANLMASVLALAMVGASNASVSKVDNNSADSDIVLNRDLHKAYYDPAGIYGTTGNFIYNYTSYDLYSNDGGSSESGPYGFGDDISFTSVNSGSGYRAYPDGVGMIEISGVEYDPDLLLDYYVDGVFVASVATWEDWDESNIYILPESAESLAGSYIWLFDHGTAPDSYTPVDMLGDIAEGLTGGIVPVAEGIGNGLQSLVQDIFLNADRDGLSVFGIVIICFAGLGLALGLSRWVLNFVDTLGARDR